MRYQKCDTTSQNAIPLFQFHLFTTSFRLRKKPKKMKSPKVYVVFDRKHVASKKGTGKLEICVYFSRQVRKFITVGKATIYDWESKAQAADVLEKIEECNKILSVMEVFGEEMIPANFDSHYLRMEKKEKPVVQKKNMYNGTDLSMSFTGWVEKYIQSEDIRIGTRKHKQCVVDAIRRFGQLETLADLTTANIMAFDHWLRDGTRTDVTIYGYHKNVKCYTKQLRMADMIPYDPYNKVKIKRGKCKERQPLSEKELKKMRDAIFDGKMERVRDLFIFAAYTGLAFCDTQLFDFATMTEKVGKMFYINGERLKTGSTFFTPILQPAMEVLEKYSYQLPKISNQKANDYLHLIQEKLNINKNLTFHVARHSFATLALAHDVPIENVARMLGHQDVKTTQIYAKVLHSTIERHSIALSKSIL